MPLHAVEGHGPVEREAHHPARRSGRIQKPKCRLQHFTLTLGVSGGAQGLSHGMEDTGDRLLNGWTRAQLLRRTPRDLVVARSEIDVLGARVSALLTLVRPVEDSPGRRTWGMANL